MTLGVPTGGRLLDEVFHNRFLIRVLGGPQTLESISVLHHSILLVLYYKFIPYEHVLTVDSLK